MVSDNPLSEDLAAPLIDPLSTDAPIRTGVAPPPPPLPEPLAATPGDTFNGTRGADKLKGGRGDDRIKGLAGDDLIVGSAGDDTLIGSSGDDTLKGGSGNDNLKGGGGDDVMVGGGGADVLRGGGGDDTLKGGGGDDRMIGGGGRDRLIGGAGNDTLFGGKDNDFLKGARGADVFQFKSADFKANNVTDRISGFEFGADIVDLSRVSGMGDFSAFNFTKAGKNVELEVGNGKIVFLGVNDVSAFSAADFGMENAPIKSNDPIVRGTEGDDTIEGGPAEQQIFGLGGNDKIGTSGGVDTLEGGAGADIFVARFVGGAFDSDVDVVSDFTYVDGDKVGLTEALNGVFFNRLDEVVRATVNRGDTVISVKRDSAFEDVIRLLDVEFQTEDLISYGFTAPAPGSLTFVDNPYGFDNNSFATADPAATADGVHVAWVDQQNLDGDPFDFTPTDGNEDNATRDVFILNTTTGALQRVSPTPPGGANIEATSPALSSDGRFVAYVQETSARANQGDVFVRDMAFPDSDPILVSVAPGGGGAGGLPISNVNRGGLNNSRSNESVSVLDISGDGKRVAFATNVDLTGGGETDSGFLDIYLRDLDAGTTTLISGSGGVARGVSSPYTSSEFRFGGDIVKISEDGRYVAFLSRFAFTDDDDETSASASDQSDLFLFDTQTGEHLLVSAPGSGGTYGFDMSADATKLVFSTDAAIDNDDFNGRADVYLAEIDLSKFRVKSHDRISEAEGGFELFDDDSWAPVISNDGKRAGFLTGARDLQYFDPNESFPDNFDGSPGEQLYVVDLASRNITTTATPVALANRDSLNTHAELTDAGVVYRKVVDAEPGAPRLKIDTIAIDDPIALPNEDAPDGDGRGDFTNARLERFTIVRGEIDSAGDADAFRFRGDGSSRDITISVEGVDSGGGSLSDPFLTVFPVDLDRTPSEIDDNSGVGRDSFTVVEIGAFANLVIKVEGVGGATGSYRLRIDDENFSPFDIFDV